MPQSAGTRRGKCSSASSPPVEARMATMGYAGVRTGNGFTVPPTTTSTATTRGPSRRLAVDTRGLVGFADLVIPNFPIRIEDLKRLHGRISDQGRIEQPVARQFNEPRKGSGDYGVDLGKASFRPNAKPPYSPRNPGYWPVKPTDAKDRGAMFAHRHIATHPRQAL